MNKAAYKQQGFTLIEIMVALLISSLMATAAISQLVTSRNIYFVQEANARIEENARYALELLNDNVKMAGYYDDTTTAGGKPTAVFYNDDCGTYTPCTADGSDPESDRFGVWLNPTPESDGNERTCTGVKLTGANIGLSIVNLFYVAAVDGISSLKCRSYSINGDNATFIAGSDAPLIEGIDRMHVLYGLTDQSPGNTTPSRYVSAATIHGLAAPAPGQNAPWASISSIRIILLAGTGYDDGADGAATRTFAMGDAAPFTPKNGAGTYDGNLRKMFSSTMVINNANF